MHGRGELYETEYSKRMESENEPRSRTTQLIATLIRSDPISSLKNSSSSRSLRNHYYNSRRKITFHTIQNTNRKTSTKLIMFKYVLVASALAAVGSAYNLLTVCNDADFKGNCVTWTGDLKKCYGLNEYKGAVSSANIFGSIRCNLYREDGCKGGGIVITGPAYNLQNFNDAASSFYCYFN